MGDAILGGSIVSDLVLVAVITALAGVIGGIAGAIGSPLGKDWVSRREFERNSAREDATRERQAAEQAAERKRQAAEQAAERKRQAAEQAADGHRTAVSETLQSMSDAMHHYDLEWRGKANYHAGAEARKAAAAAWKTSRGMEDQAGRDLVDEWRQGIDRADMEYRRGSEPPDRQELLRLFGGAAERLGELLRPAGELATEELE
jgi:hypothetical protein